MNERTTEVTIGERTLRLSPLSLGGLKRQRDRLSLLTEMRADGELPNAATVDAMTYVTAEAAGLYPGSREPEYKGDDSAAVVDFATYVEKLEFLGAITQLSGAIVQVMRLSGLAKDDASGAAVGAPIMGEGQAGS